MLAQVETDKATMEMESPSTGYIAKVFVSAGTKELPLGQVRKTLSSINACDVVLICACTPSVTLYNNRGPEGHICF